MINLLGVIYKLLFLVDGIIRFSIILK